MIKVVLVDDHLLVRTALKRLLDEVKGIKIIGIASTGEDAVQLVRQQCPDVVIMDIKMPGIGGLEAARKMIRHNPDLKILGLSSYKDEPLPARFVQIGGAGYITKDAGIEELVQAVREVHSGKRYLTAEIAHEIALHHLVEEENPLEVLSERELQVMIMITGGETVMGIAEKLCISTKTVNSYRYRLFDKLRISSDVELTHLAIKHGLIEIEKINN